MTIYMDNSATTRVRKEVAEAMHKYLEENYYNPSSLYNPAKKVAEDIAAARAKVASVINVKPEEIFFTGGGTEADNIAVKGYVYANRDKGKHIITTKIEHPAILQTCAALEKDGFEVTYLNVDKNGTVSLQSLEEAIRPDTILISIMWANNEIGTIQDMEGLSDIAKKHNIAFHTDIVQAYGKMPIDLSKLHIQMASVSAHKLYGPKGVGAIYIKKGTNIQPLVSGGGQEKGIRPGTENTAGMIGFGIAAELIHDELNDNIVRLNGLAARLREKMREIDPHIIFTGHTTNRVPGHVSVIVPDQEGETMVLMMDEIANICISSGSACSSKSKEASKTLRAMGYGNKEAYGSLRISMGKYNTEADVDAFCENFAMMLRMLKGVVV